MQYIWCAGCVVSLFPFLRLGPRLRLTTISSRSLTTVLSDVFGNGEKHPCHKHVLHQAFFCSVRYLSFLIRSANYDMIQLIVPICWLSRSIDHSGMLSIHGHPSLGSNYLLLFHRNILVPNQISKASLFIVPTRDPDCERDISTPLATVLYHGPDVSPCPSCESPRMLSRACFSLFADVPGMEYWRLYVCYMDRCSESCYWHKCHCLVWQCGKCCSCLVRHQYVAKYLHSKPS